MKTYIASSVDDLIRKGEEISVQATDRKRIHAWQVLRVRVGWRGQVVFRSETGLSVVFPPGCQVEKSSDERIDECGSPVCSSVQLGVCLGIILIDEGEVRRQMDDPPFVNQKDS